MLLLLPTFLMLGAKNGTFLGNLILNKKSLPKIPEQKTVFWLLTAKKQVTKVTPCVSISYVFRFWKI